MGTASQQTSRRFEFHTPQVWKRNIITVLVTEPSIRHPHSPKIDMPEDTNQPDAPPSYAMATGSSTTSNNKSNHLDVPGSHNGISAAHRRSMEDELRPLPEGWIRQWDDKEQHQFFVDTKASPPRSIWVHPYDDEIYLNSLSSEQRERLQEEERERRVLMDHTDDEGLSPSKAKISAQSTGSSSFPPDLPPRTARPGSTATKGSFSDRMKEKMTGMTKEERAQLRAQLEKQEQEYYEAHIRFRQAMNQAQMTGQPAFFARDQQGHEIYIEPPNAYRGGYGPYGNHGYAYNPYQSGPYANPNARFIRPTDPYGRPYGTRPGGGYGLPIAGGVLGGLLLGGLIF